MTARPGYPPHWPPVLIGRFLLQHADARPDRVAVVSDGREHTYGELAAAAESHRRALRDAGLRHGDPVVVRAEPGFGPLAVLLACSEAGLVHVPCNADLPADRVHAVCRAVAARAYVTGNADPDAPEQVPVRAVVRGGELDVRGRIAEPGPDREVLESDTAYVIFTSGSTGAPKGVEMSHRAAVVAFRGIADACAARERLASTSPLGFDLGLLDAAAALGHGRTLVYVPRPIGRHPRLLVEYLIRERVGQLHCVPTLWTMILRHGGPQVGELGVRRTVVGGEELTVATVEAARAVLPGLEVVNLYGQTETICCAFHPVPDPVPAWWRSVPLGSAYPGSELVLVGDDGRAQACVGDVGELYLRSAAMFEGYWDDPGLTARVLVEPPVAGARRGERWLRTGDRAELTEDGPVFVGRADNQVQIYGNRVEPEEIERCLLAEPGVNAAGVVPWRRGDEHLLVATVVLAAPDSTDRMVAALRDRCGRHLPRYMVPSRFRTVGRMPLSASGKIDRAALTRMLDEDG